MVDLVSKIRHSENGDQIMQLIHKINPKDQEGVRKENFRFLIDYILKNRNFGDHEFEIAHTLEEYLNKDSEKTGYVFIETYDEEDEQIINGYKLTLNDPIHPYIHSRYTFTGKKVKGYDCIDFGIGIDESKFRGPENIPDLVLDHDNHSITRFLLTSLFYVTFQGYHNLIKGKKFFDNFNDVYENLKADRQYGFARA